MTVQLDQAVGDQALDFLARLGANPAVAFYEHDVAFAITSILGQLGLAYRSDQYGNIIVRIPGKGPDTVPLALVAHMDHPGFEAVSVEGEYLVGVALGGVPAGAFSAGVPLHVVLPGGERLPAVVEGRHGDEASREVLISLRHPQAVELPRPVVFDLPDYRLEGDTIHMRAVDDLAGCASILATLGVLASRPPAGDVYGMFTRAEEVGLVGARLAAGAGTLPPETLVLSAESSRALPGAEAGEGPVIRVGDAGFTFDAEAESAMIRARETLQARPQGFKVQRQLMSGGTCEASAFAIYGYRTTGIAFPLGNYHNGGADGRIEAEFIRVEDFIGGIQLMVETAHRVSDRANTGVQQRLRIVPDDLRRRLEETSLE